MMISEAQSVLHCPDAYGGIYGEKYGQALAVAFKSLEAWEKVKAEIETLIEWHDCPIEYDNGNDAWYCEACNQALKIIDKYKAESEENEKW